MFPHFTWGTLNLIMGEAEMRQTKVKPNHVDADFKDVAAVAHRMVWTGRLPTLNAICEELNVRNTDTVRQYFELWKAGYRHVHADKSHIVDLPSGLKHLLVDDFERRVSASKAKLDAECSEIRVERDRLAMVNEQRASQIQTLNAALMDAESKVDEQTRRIAMLEIEIASERHLRMQMEQRIRDAMQELTRVGHRLEDHFPESAGGV
jgi:hypothetical protein